MQHLPLIPSREERSKLSTQELLENVVIGLNTEDLKQLQTPNGAFKPFAEWIGIDIAHNILTVTGAVFQTTGRLDLRWISSIQTVHRLRVSDAPECIIDMSDLPPSFREISVTNTKLIGNTSIENQNRLSTLKLVNAELSGDLCFTGSAILTVDLSNNRYKHVD